MNIRQIVNFIRDMFILHKTEEITNCSIQYPYNSIDVFYVDGSQYKITVEKIK